ncbi:hypothetical protein HYV85_06550, partial [Candidatus Woesearchaeota archaeon]|nr:hypothetical protein [Candidatus Woesearchaeota archaeon]
MYKQAKQAIRNFGFVFLLLILVFISLYSLPVLGVVSSGTARLNVSSYIINSTYINFSSGAVSNLSGHVKWDNRSGIQTASWMASTQYGFLNASPNKIHALGPKSNMSVYSVPHNSDAFYGDGGQLFYANSTQIIWAVGDGFAVMTNNNTYGFIEINGIAFDSHVNITWKFQSNGSNSFSTGSDDPPLTGCLRHTTEAVCWNASTSGETCYWDNFLKSCQQTVGGGGSSGGGGAGASNKTDCFVFDGNKAGCGNISVCQWFDSQSLCDPNPGFDYAKGVTCPDFVNKSVCNNQPFTSPLCTWNGTGAGALPVGNCSANVTKTYNSLPVAPYSNCEATPTQNECTLQTNTYFMQCEWDGNKSKCKAALHGVFGGDSGGNYFDITTKSSCEASGGTWKTEQYTYTDSYGNTQTASSSWCEPSFGNFGKESCNDACWACEKQSDGTNWADNATAAQKCTNSTLGFCKWIPDANSWNGQGWCEPENFIGFGFADCSTNCFGCFKNNTCGTSAANCSWIQDSFSFDTNNDGKFNASEDGWCDKKLVADKKDCSKTCLACQGQSNCEASLATCVWNTTGSFAPFCHTTGTVQEVCFLPGDEDNDGQFDCADVNSCNQDPFCGFGFGSGTGGAGLAAGTVNNTACIQHDNNQANCLIQNGTGLMNLTPVCYYHPAPGQETQFPTFGWCDPIFEQNMIGGMLVDVPPEMIGFDGSNDNTSGQNWTDIFAAGVHESPGGQEKFDIGMAMLNLSHFAGCNKVNAYKTVTKNLTEKFYRFIDSDNNESSGCWVNGTLYGGPSPFGAQFNLSGFDYKFFYTENTTSGEYKVSFKCVSGSWMPFSAQLAVMKELCVLPSTTPAGQGGPEAGSMPGGAQVMVINKADIGSPKNPIRILLMTANSSDNLTSLTDAGSGSNETTPVDIAGPFYYTPGSIDKKFENCQATGQDVDGDGLTADNDPDCTLFKKFGFVPFEGGTQCKDGKDNDNNGKIDCNDVSCKYDPFSGCGFGMTCDPTDKSPPSQKWLEASIFPEGASISFNSDEPSNGTITFYGNDSKCLTLNSTIKDFGLIDTTTGNEYKPWHDALIDKYSVNATLYSNRTYYYKFKMCDLCGNCLSGACTNFTTSTSYTDYVFKPVPSAGLQIDIPQLGVSGDSMTYGKKVNASNAQNIDITVKDPTIGYNITLHNVSVFSAATINITTLYSSNSTSKLVGINSTSWSTILQKLGVKYVTITIPDNGTKLVKCAEENVSNCVDVTSNA